jgi:hypothetical protein
MHLSETHAGVRAALEGRLRLAPIKIRDPSLRYHFRVGGGPLPVPLFPHDGLSITASWRDKPQLFWDKRPVNRRSASDTASAFVTAWFLRNGPLERDRPFPDALQTLFGKGGHFLRSVEILCPDAAAAKEYAKQLVDGHDVELWQGDRQKAVQRYSLPNRCSTSPACARARAMSSSVNAALMLVQVSLNLAFASAKFRHIPMSRASCGLP